MKDKKTYKLLACAGFIGIAGLQHFYTLRIGKGILYFVTFGGLFIGTIIDLVKANESVDQYNAKRGYIDIKSRS